jgi:hypothetical protein
VTTNLNWIDDIYAGAPSRSTSLPTLRSAQPRAYPSTDSPMNLIDDVYAGARRPHRFLPTDSAPNGGRELTFAAYLAESRENIDRLGLPPAIGWIIKTAITTANILLAPIDYPMWRQVKRGKMSPWTRTAVIFGIVYLLHRGSKAAQERQDMKEQAKYFAKAMQKKVL